MIFSTSSPGDTFTADAEDATLSWCQEVDRAWLKKVGWIVHLLGKVKAVVHGDGLRARWIGSQTSVHSHQLGIGYLLPVELPLLIFAGVATPPSGSASEL